ncbi:lactate utilization protein C [Streptomyces sp. SID8379]|uniref:LutC/YkgG family protein n=1 Tax=unclassified Streptomyces TaxID=2593676 RepID=UPI0003A3C88B|nr:MULTISPECIES: lactate utilization protein C [unclassified Streptomyces]MYW69499.1 lactate utilization protein C [Streptomyces sp. SID8379]
MSSRDVILGRVRRALDGPIGAPTTYDTDITRTYRQEHGSRTTVQTVDLLAENLADYRALVHRCSAADLTDTVTRLLDEHGTRSVVAPPGLPKDWLSGTGATRVADGQDGTPAELDQVDSVVTGCAVAVAETGTIVLDGSPDQGRRRITLVPDHHVIVVRVPDQVVSSVPQALERLDPARPLTWISGPSATSDIELDRVEGVHGPRTLEVILVSGD